MRLLPATDLAQYLVLDNRQRCCEMKRDTKIVFHNSIGLSASHGRRQGDGEWRHMREMSSNLSEEVDDRKLNSPDGRKT